MIGTASVYGPVAPNYFPWNTMLLWYAICWFIMFVPFLITDLFYAYRDTSCVNTPASASIGLTLSTWLQVDGWIILGFLVIFILLGVLAIPYPAWQCVYVLWENLHVLFILWRMSWLIVGAVLWWRDYNPLNFCQSSVRKYMWANLIIGFVWLFVELVLAFAYVRPIARAIPVPVAGTPTGPVIVPTTLASSAVLRPGIRY